MIHSNFYSDIVVAKISFLSGIIVVFSKIISLMSCQNRHIVKWLIWVEIVSWAWIKRTNTSLTPSEDMKKTGRNSEKRSNV